jgi:hypothetical protein
MSWFPVQAPVFYLIHLLHWLILWAFQAQSRHTGRSYTPSHTAVVQVIAVLVGAAYALPFFPALRKHSAAVKSRHSRTMTR